MKLQRGEDKIWIPWGQDKEPLFLKFYVWEENLPI